MCDKIRYFVHKLKTRFAVLRKSERVLLVGGHEGHLKLNKKLPN